MECFASPFNCSFPRFCSAFFDVDEKFGSKGSFFDFYPKKGSFEVNPPFHEPLLLRINSHLSSLLHEAESHNRELSFVLIVRKDISATSWRNMTASPFKRYEKTLWLGEHYFLEGAAYLRKNQVRRALHDSSFFILQTSKASKRLKLTEDNWREIEKAFCSSSLNAPTFIM